jgi:protein-disulfide isomerase
MVPEPPDLPDARRSRVSWWALVPIALGGLILVGGTIAGLVFALRDGSTRAARAATGASAVATAPATTGFGAAPPGVTAPPKLPPPEFEDDEGGETTDDPPEESVELSRSPEGERVWPDESSALLPITKGQAVWGLATAPVTVALFGDLSCEHTRAELRSLARIVSRRGANVRLVFYHRPLAEHAQAKSAALVLAATSLQVGNDAAWRVLSKVAASAEEVNDDEVARWLSAAGVFASRESLLRDPLAAAQLEADRLLALKLDVRATPTIFVNGERVTGHVADAELERVIDVEARTMRWLVAQGIPPAQAYARRVRKNVIGVGLGVDARWCVPEEDAPAEGASAPLLTIVEFSDFECEACSSLEPALTATVARHANVVRRVWRSFALPQHRHAARAAAFALSARELGGDRAFWTVHAALFGARSVELDDEQLRRVAAHLGLDADKLLTLAERAERTTELERDHALAESLGLDGAPTLFMNGRRIAGAPPPEALEGLVREELDIAKRLTKAGADSARIRALLCED